MKQNAWIAPATATQEALLQVMNGLSRNFPISIQWLHGTLWKPINNTWPWYWFPISFWLWYSTHSWQCTTDPADRTMVIQMELMGSLLQVSLSYLVYCLGLVFGTFTYPPLEVIFFVVMHFVEMSYKPC